MDKDSATILVSFLLGLRKEVDEGIRDIVWDYAKMEGLVAASYENKDRFAYKKIIREELGLEI